MKTEIKRLFNRELWWVDVGLRRHNYLGEMTSKDALYIIILFIYLIILIILINKSKLCACHKWEAITQNGEMFSKHISSESSIHNGQRNLTGQKQMYTAPLENEQRNKKSFFQRTYIVPANRHWKMFY